MPGSWGYFKHQIHEYLTKNFSKDDTVLDVGCGQGDYYEMLKDHFNSIDAVEIWEPYITQFDLKNKYRNLYNIDIMKFDFDYYDIIILGDIIEHLSREDAVTLLNKITHKCKELIVVVPYYLPQEIVNDNIYERHLQPDLDDQIMEDYYPMIKLHNLNGQELKLRIDVGENVYYYCVFTKKNISDD
jgi:16S rRNA A1518/A1519 N6-dimethyltransferase RsmA/KsgA/DIM1 with predicted DNA glycosylase/AP lyase activity